MTDNPIQLVGLIGWPVEHSVSPAMHNAAFDALGVNWRYTLLPTPPGKVKATLTKLKEQGYRGANVTVPHKQVVMPHLDEITGAARDIGAVFAQSDFSNGPQIILDIVFAEDVILLALFQRNRAGRRR